MSFEITFFKEKIKHFLCCVFFFRKMIKCCQSTCCSGTSERTIETKSSVELFILWMRILRCYMYFDIINFWIPAILDFSFICLYVALRYLYLQSHRLVLMSSSDRLCHCCLCRYDDDLFIFWVTFTSNTEELVTY